MKSQRASLGFIFVTLALDALGIGVIIPVAPLLINKVTGAAGDHIEPAAQFYVGVLTALYAAMNFLFAPLLGSLSDRFGRRPVLLFSMFGSGIDYFAMALAPTLPWLLATRVVNGITGANITTAMAYIADVTPPEKRAAGFGLIGAAFGLGFVVGPLVGGVLGDIDIHLPFYVAGGLTMFNWLYGLLVLPESLPPEKRGPFVLARANPVGALRYLLKYPAVLWLAVTLTLVVVAQASLQSTWVIYTTSRYGWTKRGVGISLAIVGVTAAIVQGGLARKIVPKLGEPRSLLFGLSVAVCAYAGYGLATEGWMIYAIIAVASIGAIAQPAGQALVSRAVSPQEQGLVSGALTSLQSLAQITGALAGSAVQGVFMGATPPLPLPGAAFLMSSAICLLGLINAVFAVRHVRRAAGQGDSDAPVAAGES